MAVSRRMIVLWSGLGGVVVVLAAALAWVGTHLDQERLGRQQLEDDYDSLQNEYEAVQTERDELQQKSNEHVKTIEQLQAELERMRKNASGAAPAPAAPASAASGAPTTTTP